MSVLRLAVMSFFLAAGGGEVMAAEETVTGTALYRERIAAPPDAVLQAMLLDVSRADAPAVEIAKTTVEKAGNPPYRFRLSYDPAKIVEKNSYAVRATLSANGELMFTTDRSYPVITGGNPKEVELLLVRAAAAKPDATLESTYWKLVAIGGKPAEVSAERREPHLILRPGGEVAGSTGCNGMGGSYTHAGEALSFGPIITTFIYCEDVAETERAFLKALPLVKGWTITGDDLRLLDGNGALLAEFRAVYF